MKKLLVSVTTATTLLIGSFSALAAPGGRNYITIVGSSTVYPFSTTVAERFGKLGTFKTPKVESTGTGGGMKLFCAGMGIDTPDIVNASRRIKTSEVETCASNGVKNITEVKIGYDSLTVAIAKSAPPMKLTREQLYLALAKMVPDPKGTEKLVKNPYKTWQDINKSLPDIKIQVMVPPTTSGTRDSFVELVMEHSCKEYAWLESMEKSNKDEFKVACDTLREEGSYAVIASENDNLTVQKVAMEKGNILGIFGYSFLEQNADKVQAVVIDNAAPTFENIASGKYPLSRPLYFYVKKGHVDSVPGILAFVAEFSSKAAAGADGYLADKGLIPMSDIERSQVIAGLKGMESGKVPVGAAKPVTMDSSLKAIKGSKTPVSP